MRLRAKEVNVTSGMAQKRSSWIVRLYLWACERLYHEFAGYYDAVSWMVSGGYWRRWQAGVWEEVEGRDVLELGFGTGELLIQGGRQGLTMFGLDRSPAMLDVARRRTRRMNVPTHIVQGDGRTLPFDEGLFDTVIATFPAGYILEPVTLLEVRRVLRPGGRFVILGLWVALDLGDFGRMFPVFYGRLSEEAQAAIAARVAAAGFMPRWVEQKAGRFTVGVLVAERQFREENREE
jgi:SAM-dependent methyltransferase